MIGRLHVRHDGGDFSTLRLCNESRSRRESIFRGVEQSPCFDRAAASCKPGSRRVDVEPAGLHGNDQFQCCDRLEPVMVAAGAVVFDEPPVNLCAERPIGGFSIRRHEVIAAPKQSTDGIAVALIASARIDGSICTPNSAAPAIAWPHRCFDPQTGCRIIGIDACRQISVFSVATLPTICQREEDMGASRRTCESIWACAHVGRYRCR